MQRGTHLFETGTHPRVEAFFPQEVIEILTDTIYSSMEGEDLRLLLERSLSGDI